MRSVRLFTLFCAAAGLVVLSCNLFAPKEADRVEYAERRGAEALVLEGKIKMRSEEWSEAYELFDKAIEANKWKAEAYYYRGKCRLRLAGVNLTDVWNEVNSTVRQETTVPFLFEEGYYYTGGSCQECPTYDNRQTTCRSGDSCFIYLGIDDTLTPPYEMSGPTGTFTAKTVVESVFLERKRIYDAICIAISDLEMIHHNPDSMDNSLQRKQYESDYLIEIAVKTILSLMDVNGNDTLDFIDPATKKRSDEFRAYRILCSDMKNIDDISLDSLKSISTDPKDINGMIDEVLENVLKADTSHLNFVTELIEAEMGDDISMVKDLGVTIDEFKLVLPFFYYDDFYDNNDNYYDTDRDGKVDRMIWIDWDQDGMCDIGAAPEVHIGDSIHMFPNGFDNSKFLNGLDTTRYEIVSVRDIIDTTRVKDSLSKLNPSQAFDAKDKSSWTKYWTSYRRHFRYRFKGGHSEEFIFGDWGVDEEIMDGKDNFVDGLVDEDTRIINDTLDDDGDRWTPEDPAQKPNQVMEWTDTDGDLILDGVAPTDRKKKENKYLVLARIIQAENATLHWADRDSSALADTTIRTYSGDPTGEYTGGVFGFDEEYFDGLDNDGDGLIDEDIAKTSVVPQSSKRGDIIDSLNANHDKLHTYWDNMRKLRRVK